MKTKILSLLLFLSFLAAQSQVITPMDALKLRYNPKKNSATRIMVQDSITGVCGWILKSSLSSGSGGTSLPSQTGNSGKFLTTNGTAPSWATVPTPNLQAVTGVSPGTQITNQIFSTEQIASYNASTSRGAGLSENGLIVAKDATNAATINADLLTATRTQQLPNKSGTFAMTSDVNAITFDTTLANGNIATDRTVKLRNTGVPAQKADFESYYAKYYDTDSGNESYISADGISAYLYYLKNGSTSRLICDELGGIITYGNIVFRNYDWETTGLSGMLHSNITAGRNWYMPDHDGTLLTDSDVTLDNVLSAGHTSTTSINIGTDFSNGLTLASTYSNISSNSGVFEKQIGFSEDNFYSSLLDIATGIGYSAYLSPFEGLKLKTGTALAGEAQLKSDLLSANRVLQLPDESGTLLTTATASSTYAPKASPTFTGTVSGITKAMVGLSAVPNTDFSVAANLPTGIDAAKIGAGAVSDTEFGYVDGVTSSIQTQLDAKATKSMSAYSFRVNNTNATANATEVTYRSSGIQTYSSSINWPSGTAPSGTQNFSYNWTQLGNQVTLNITLIYGTAGATLTSVILGIPSDCPTPVAPTGISAASEVLYTGVGRLSPSKTNTTATTALAAIRNNSANTAKEIIIQQASGSHIMAQVTIQYFTN